MDGVSFGFRAEMYIRYKFSQCKNALATEESKHLACRLSPDFQTAEYQLYIAAASLFRVVCKEILDGHGAFLRSILSCMSQLSLIEHAPAASEAHCVMTVNRGMNEAGLGGEGFPYKPDGATTNLVWAFDGLRCEIKSGQKGKKSPAVIHFLPPSSRTTT